MNSNFWGGGEVVQTHMYIACGFKKRWGGGGILRRETLKSIKNSVDHANMLLNKVRGWLKHRSGLLHVFGFDSKQIKVKREPGKWSCEELVHQKFRAKEARCHAWAPYRVGQSKLRMVTSELRSILDISNRLQGRSTNCTLRDLIKED